MVNIKVPIGRGLLSQPEFKKQIEKEPSNDIEFFKKLTDSGKMIILKGDGASAANIITRIVPQGKTFYLIEATIADEGGGVGAGALVIITGGANISQKRMDYTGNADLTIKGWSFIGDGTTPIGIRAITGGEQNASLIGYEENTPTTSSRGDANTLES